MSEHIFKPGELAWSPFSGFKNIEITGPWICHGQRLFFTNGKYHEHDKAPTLLTVEQAAKLGYFPEKKKVKKKLYQAILKADINGYVEYYTVSVLFFSLEEAKQYLLGKHHFSEIILKEFYEIEVEE